MIKELFSIYSVISEIKKQYPQATITINFVAEYISKNSTTFYPGTKDEYKADSFNRISGWHLRV